MRYSHADADKSRATDLRAAVFIDYENLFTYLYGRIGSRGRPDETISELLDELKRYLIEEVRAQTAHVSAYADFGEMHGSGQYIQRALYLRGIEPRFVPMTLQKNAAELQLTIDSVEAMHSRPDLQLFVIVTGDRPYLPLVQQFKQSGSHALIVMLAPPPSTDNLPGVEDDVFLNAVNLLSDATRRTLLSSSASAPSAPRQASQGRPQPVEYKTIKNAGALQALEIIEEHFGQYEEVYLTPLLRKLSELLDEDRYDPKTLISELEDAGAVWLEKRRGFPYDYTVLLIDAEHPDVAAVQKQTYVDHGEDDYATPYDDHDDEYYPKDDDEYDDEYVDDLEDELDDELDDYDDELDEDDEAYADDEDAYSNGTAEADDDVLDDYADDYPEEEDFAEEGDEEPR